MDVPKPEAESQVATSLQASQRELQIALRFCGSLFAAALFLPPGGLLWQPGALTTVGGWCVETVLAIVF